MEKARGDVRNMALLKISTQSTEGNYKTWQFISVIHKLHRATAILLRILFAQDGEIWSDFTHFRVLGWDFVQILF